MELTVTNRSRAYPEGSEGGWKVREAEKCVSFITVCDFEGIEKDQADAAWFFCSCLLETNIV